VIALACRDTSDDYAAAARIAASESVLTLADLPEGWREPSTGGPVGISNAELGLEGECAIFNEPNASSFEGAVATRAPRT
jgi:hypothetical protein